MGLHLTREKFRLRLQKILTFHASAIADDNDFLTKIVFPRKKYETAGVI
jgi:hypothetical protein